MSEPRTVTDTKPVDEFAAGVREVLMANKERVLDEETRETLFTQLIQVRQRTCPPDPLGEFYAQARRRALARIHRTL